MKIKTWIPTSLGVTASVLNVLAFGIYNWQTFQGKASPNIISWAVWAFMTALNFTSYRAMSKDWLKSLLPTVSGIQCILTFILATYVGQVKAIGAFDIIALEIGIVASFLWWRLKANKEEAPMIANMMLQLGITVGFIPTFQSVWLRPGSEVPLCWFLWTISFLIQTIVVTLRWRGKKRDLVYPLNCLWLHFAVALLSIRNSP